MNVRLVRLLAAGLAALLMILCTGRSALKAGPADAPDDRDAGLKWRFVRIHYHFRTEGSAIPSEDYVGEPWYIDAPAAEQNLSRRLKTLTTVDVEDPMVLSLDDARLFEHPWIYFVEGGNLKLLDTEVPILREFLLRGGTATFDDFHGPAEWNNLAHELARVFPDREIVETPPGHPIFSAFFSIDRYPQVPGLGSFLAGRTWEKGGYMAHLRMILDDDQRPMVLINWNTDMGDGWEWSNAAEYPEYLKYTEMAYRMEINEILYSLTH
jgi:hypothetical protein